MIFFKKKKDDLEELRKRFQNIMQQHNVQNNMQMGQMQQNQMLNQQNVGNITPQQSQMYNQQFQQPQNNPTQYMQNQMQLNQNQMHINQNQMQVNQNQMQTKPVKVVSIEGNKVHETVIHPQQKEESLEELKREFDEAKINSLIIKQVKELIEIDSELNKRIETTESDLVKLKSRINEIEKKIFELLEQIRETNQRMDKFVGLYELVTNQVNPFVKKEEKKVETKINQQEINKKQELLLKNVPQGMEFKLSNGKVIHNIYELIEALKNEPDEVINQHINENKNDFASWVRFVIGNQELADIMEKAKDKMSLLITLKGYFS